ncbi:MAG TPA: hypothetical protein VFN34_13150 [Ornithinibacter sp.]|nr:hypothetical protein [Ornithinibacter sp.]
MAEPSGRRVVLAAAGGLVVIVLLVVARGPVALLAVATVAVLAGVVLGVPPLLRHDGIDWGWQPDLQHETLPEPGIANLRRLLAPSQDDTAAPARLQELVRAIAEDRAPGALPAGGALTAYLSAPPRRLGLDEVDAVITELETLSPKETS